MLPNLETQTVGTGSAAPWVGILC